MGSGGGGGHRVVKSGSSRTCSDSVFGNQPVRPPYNVVTSTWGATMSTPYWWNDMRNGNARLQPASADEPVLVTPEGFVYRSGCGNRVAPADAPMQEVVENVSSGGGIYQDNRSQTDYKLEFNMPITIISGGGGFSSPQRSMRPQQRQLRPRYCIVRDNCGRPIGRRMIGYR